MLKENEREKTNKIALMFLFGKSISLQECFRKRSNKLRIIILLQQTVQLFVIQRVSK